MIREYCSKDLIEINKLLDVFDYKISSKSFDNPFLNILVYDGIPIKGVLVYQHIFDRIEIDYIVVSELYRNLGIAAKLLSFIENKHNVKNITLEVRESNLIARNFYTKNGFKEVAIRQNYYNNENGILMLKNLGE